MTSDPKPPPAPSPHAPAVPTECDLVMKGGITSGIVYPLAVRELASRFRLRSIGGASAGAIAAAAAAAAELGRREGLASFDSLAELPKWLAGNAPAGDPTPLSRLFQPEPETAALYTFITEGMAPGGSKAMRWLSAAAKGFPLHFALGVALAASVLFGCLRVALGTSVGWALLVAFAGALAALVVGVLPLLLGVLHILLWKLPRNDYGLCRGITHDADAIGLSPWLHETLQRLAGREPDDAPLTFGDLWGGDALATGEEHPAHATPRRRDIDLRLMTTVLSHGRPYSFPLEPTELLFFREEELAPFFPASVVEWMVSHPRPVSPAETLDGYLPLPRMQDLPVLITVRMSSAFPLLLSAVPLHRRSARGPEKVWFSDGGICSNFPIHFFDSVLPRRPTFGINLVDDRYVPDDPRDPEDFVYVPRRNSDGQSPYRIDVDRGGAPSLLGLLGAIKDTMQNWNDNAQLRVPGFRDRVAQIRLRPDEGGLNLRMAPEVIARLSLRGQVAAKRLIAHFLGEEPSDEVRTTWPNHRWVRFRTSMALFEEALANILAAEKLLGETKVGVEALHENQPSYRYGSVERTEASLEAYGELLAVAESLAARAETLGHPIFAPPQSNAPRPPSQLRIKPRL